MNSRFLETIVLSDVNLETKSVRCKKDMKDMIYELFSSKTGNHEYFERK